MSGKPTNVALVQMQCASDPAANLEKAIHFIREAAGLTGSVPKLLRGEAL